MSNASLLDILDELSAHAWRKPCQDFGEANFLLSLHALGQDPPTSERLRQILRTMYEHARIWAPGLDIPFFVPPVRIANLQDTEAGYFSVDKESYASIAVSREFLADRDATLLILAHEACHHILLQSGVSYRYKTDPTLNERVTDLCMFVCGFGEIVKRGHSAVIRQPDHLVSSHLGYLNSEEYAAAYRHVLAKRTAQGLPGIPRQASIWRRLCRYWSGFGNSRVNADVGSTLLEQAVAETERQNKRKS
jgi:hypothetical protein